MLQPVILFAHAQVLFIRSNIALLLLPLPTTRVLLLSSDLLRLLLRLLRLLLLRLLLLLLLLPRLRRLLLLLLLGLRLLCPWLLLLPLLLGEGQLKLQATLRILNRSIVVCGTLPATVQAQP